MYSIKYILEEIEMQNLIKAYEGRIQHSSSSALIDISAYPTSWSKEIAQQWLDYWDAPWCVLYSKERIQTRAMRDKKRDKVIYNGTFVDLVKVRKRRRK